MPENPLLELLDIMRRLRDPATGCPWDLEQDFDSIAPYTLEEAYEVVDAIRKGDKEAIREELGDLLFQVVFHARLASEKGWFDFDAVAAAICEKLVRRHPHVFASAKISDSTEQTVAWEAHKALERKARQNVAPSELDHIPLALPELVRAEKLQSRAARVGFDWPDMAGVIAKLDEEVEEFKQAGHAGGDTLQQQKDELGDILFTCVNLARHLNTDAESLLRAANAKFERRFRALETAAGGGEAMASLSPEELEQCWQRIKLAEE